MSEVGEVAASLVRRHGWPRAGETPRAWLERIWPDWREWLSHQQADNLLEAVRHG